MTSHESNRVRFIERFHFEQAHAVGSSLETKQNPMFAGDNEEIDKHFDYRGAAEILMCLATCSRPDLEYAVVQLHRFVLNPTKTNVGILRLVLRYIADTLDHGIIYKRTIPTQTPSVII